MSMPKIWEAASAASSADLATLTPPALPRPPTLTCALTTTTPPLLAPIFTAAARASSTLSATMPASTGTPWASNMSRAWYSKRSTSSSSSLRMGTSQRIVCGGQARDFNGVHQMRPTSPKSTSVRRDVSPYPVNDLGGRGARGEDLGDTELVELGDVGLGDDAAAEH